LTREVVRSPIVRVLPSQKHGFVYLREVKLNGRIIGALRKIRAPTSILTILTDKEGNLVTMFPRRL